MRTILLLCALAGSAGQRKPVDEFQRERETLAEHMSKAGIRDERVLAAVRSVPRELFVPEAHRSLAYADSPLPIGLGQTISQPYVVAVMTESLEVKNTHRVLEIGTGSGYQAAILSGLAGEIFSIELEPELALAAKERLHRLGYSNVVVKQGDGYEGWAEKAPFDRIIVTAAPPEVPKKLIEQLKPGGRLIAPVGTGAQWLEIVDKALDGRLTKRRTLAVRFVPMRPASK
jgi:protein-L-isoaspartate(D-aspartate) O-methyltransferase